MEPDDGSRTAVPVSRPAAAVSGLVAAAAALAAGELAAAPAAPLPGPVYAVANRVVDGAPAWFVELGKSVFGLADKPALVLGTIMLAVLVGASLGLASRRSPRPGLAGIAGFGLAGLVSIGTDAQGSWLGAVMVTLVAMAAGAVTLVLLLSRATPAPATAARAEHPAPATPEPATAGPATALEPAATVGAPAALVAQATPVTAFPTDPPVSRRGFLNLAAAVGATAAVATVAATLVRSRSSAARARDSIQLDSRLAGSALEEAVEAANRSPVATTAGVSSLITPNDSFYLIDTALLKPQVDPANWQLRITGMVDREVVLSYDELTARSLTVAPVTLSCVSNPVGGDLVGSAIWQGVPLVELLDQAGVQEGATQIASRSVDGWTCGFPTEAAYDGRTALVAVAMNDEPLPVAHGFPARLVVAGLYGYVSATKWLSEIRLTTWEDFDGYWVPRGWSKLGPVKTQARIDTPRSGATFTAGREVPVAGVAWAPDRGIERVEIRVDDGPWLEAELGDALGVDSWRQWLVRWTATPGRHGIEVRATDGTGDVQTSDEAPPAPSGATGWHRIEIDVG